MGGREKSYWLTSSLGGTSGEHFILSFPFSIVEIHFPIVEIHSPIVEIHSPLVEMQSEIELHLQNQGCLAVIR